MRARSVFAQPPGADAPRGEVEALLAWHGTMKELTLQLNFTLAAVRPGGQDDVLDARFYDDWGESLDDDPRYLRVFDRPPALVFDPISAGDSPPTAPAFTMAVREVARQHVSHSVQVRLRKIAGAASGVDEQTHAYVFDPEPLLIAKVDAGTYQRELAQGLTDEIGNYTSDPGREGWEVSAGAEGFDLHLPPQGVGEAMHKRKDASDIDPAAKEPIDFRFTPTAQFRLRPSYYEQRFAEVPWNLRRILGYPGQRAPGAGLDEVNFELFYGMAVHIQTPGLRLSEIGARLGRAPGPQRMTIPRGATESQRGTYAATRALWAILYAQLRSRIAVLEPRAEGESSKLLLNETTGTQVTLRKSAQLKYPIPGVEPAAPEFTLSGLAGGWAWGFESHNILQAVLRDRQSVAAELHGLFYSSFGGWGHQKASFDGGRSTIYCQVEQGRVSSINIERIGRIEPFWNKAKHVIVYARSVAASRQFYLDQEPFLGSPILRKVEEYIELIEDERPFTERQTHEQDRGCVLACRFGGGKPPRIHVDSAWGGDVGKTGWQVPLWRRGAAPADVYPRPDVQLRLAGTVEGESILPTISDPEKIAFYTKTAENSGNDSDVWPPVPGLSCDVLLNDEIIKPEEGNIGATDASDFGVTKDKPEPLVKEGHGRFTFHFDAPPGPANVTATRAAERVVTLLDNVTVMRGAVTVPKADPTTNRHHRTIEVRQAFAIAKDQLANRLHKAVGQLGREINAPAGELDSIVKSLRNEVASYGADLQAVLNELKENLNLVRDTIRQTLERRIVTTPAALVGDCLQLAHAARDQISKLIKTASQQFPTLDDDAKAWMSDRLRELWRGERSIDPWARDPRLLTQLRELLGGADTFVRDVRSAFRAAQRELAEARVAVDGAVRRLSAATTPVERVAIVQAARIAVDERLHHLGVATGQPARAWLGNQINANQFEVDSKAEKVREQLAVACTLADSDEVGAARALDEAANLLKDGAALEQTVRLKLEQWRNAGTSVARKVDLAAPVVEVLAGLLLLLLASLDDSADYEALRVRIDKTMDDFASRAARSLEAALRAVAGTLAQHAEALFDELKAFLLPDLDQLKDWAKQLFDPKVIDDLEKRLRNSRAALRDELDRLRNRWGAALDDLASNAHFGLPSLADIGLNVSADAPLRLFRAFGRVPKLPDLEFSVPDCGFHFFDLKLPPLELPNFNRLPAINLTRMAAKARDLADGLLNPLNLRLPIQSLAERFIPFDLKNIDFNTMFRNWGGMDLSKLFAGLKFPSLQADGVRVTHGLERASRTAWMQADINVPFLDQPTTVFSLAGLTLRLTSAKFTGLYRVEAVLGQPPKQTIRGSIRGDWELTIGSFAIATMADSR
ncbi:MAG: hypothetical protein QM770_04640 [Tepidisphaeraceae bacterium]